MKMEKKSAGGRRTVVQACLQQNVVHRRPSRGNAGIRSWSLQDAGLHYLGHPVYRVLGQPLPSLLRRGMFVQGLYRIGRRTLRRAVTSSNAYRQCRHCEDDDERTRNAPPTTFEICQTQHSRLTRSLPISYHIVLRRRKQRGVTTVTELHRHILLIRRLYAWLHR